MPFNWRWGRPTTLDTMLQQIVAIVVATGAAVVFAAIAWVGHHLS